MTSKDFNYLITIIANERLLPFGFKKKGMHYYIYKTPNIMVFYTRMIVHALFKGFCIAVTHDFIEGTTDEKGKLKIPPYLENYPFSISVEALKEQYTKHRSAADFSYDTNFMTREVLTTRKFTSSNPMDIITIASIKHDNQKAESYIKSAMDIVVDEGMRLFNEYTPAISYRAVTRYKNADDIILNKHRAELEKYLARN